jgi:hypothetical protein
MTFALITGKTMRKAVKTGVRPEPRKRKAMRITDITGVAEITVKKGLRNALARLSRPAAIPAAIPRGTATAIPPNTLRRLPPRAARKRGVFIRTKKLFSTGNGPGRIMSES